MENVRNAKTKNQFKILYFIGMWALGCYLNRGENASIDAQLERTLHHIEKWNDRVTFRTNPCSDGKNQTSLTHSLSLCFSRREWDAASMVIFRCHTDLYKSFSLVDVASRWLSFFLLQLFHMTNSIVNYCVLAQNTDVICKNFHHHIVFVLTQLNSYWARYMVSNSYTDSCTHPSNIRHIPFEPFALWGKFVIGNSELDAVICE